MINNNILTLTDSYKLSHWPQYPDGTEYVYSYFESRVGAKYDKTVFFGLQYLIKKHLTGTVVTKEKIDEAEWLSNNHMGPGIFNRAGWEYILKEYGGKLPVKIMAVPEGTPVSVDNVMMTVVNTDPNVPWLTNLLETLLVQTWYPATVATLSRACKEMLLGHLDKSGTKDNINFMLHDFGVRGSTCMEAAAIGGLAHLTQFMGTDNLPALILARDYYNSTEVVGFSVNASEHSTITSHGPENELEIYRRYFQDLYPSGIAACVADSWNVFKAAEMWAGPLKNMIMARDGKAVFRPDSGDPKEIDPMVVNILGEGFGFTENHKGYKALPTDKIGVIQGDGCNPEMMDEVLTIMEDDYNQSSDNIIFGMGGKLLQGVDRDTQRFAFKCSEVIVKGERRDVSKDPITDKGKKSKKGRLCLIRNENGDFETVPQTEENLEKDILKTVFENGELLEEYHFDDIRAVVNQNA